MAKMNWEKKAKVIDTYYPDKKLPSGNKCNICNVGLIPSKYTNGEYCPDCHKNKQVQILKQKGTLKCPICHDSYKLSKVGLAYCFTGFKSTTNKH